VNRSFLLPVFAALIGAVTSSEAGILTGVYVDPGSGSPLSVPAIADFSPTGFKMDGMQVTVKFSDGSSATDTWEGTGGDTGEAKGNNWSLTETHNTFYSTWNLTNKTSLRITQLVIKAGILGNTVFDLQKNDFSLPGDNQVTPGGTDFNFEGTIKSERGWTFDPLNLNTFTGPSMGGDLAVKATYRIPVKLDSAGTPVGDLWTELDIEFGGSAGGLASWQNIVGLMAGDPVIFSFKADTDTFSSPAESTVPVPEPSSLMAMLGLGSLCFAVTRRPFGKRATR
jgi:hypothetical protein